MKINRVAILAVLASTFLGLSAISSAAVKIKFFPNGAGTVTCDGAKCEATKYLLYSSGSKGEKKSYNIKLNCSQQEGFN